MDSELPREPQIDLLQPRSALGAFTAVPEMTRSRIRHGSGIEPYIPAAGEVLIGGLARGRDTVGTALRGTCAPVARPIQHGDLEPRVGGENGVHLPIAQARVGNLVRGLERAIVAERQ